MIGSLYRQGDTALHRLPAGVKLAGLAIFSASLMFITDQRMLAVAFLIGLLCVISTRVPRSVARNQLLFPVIVLSILFVAQIMLLSAGEAVSTIFRLAAILLNGYAVTLTTKTSELMATLEHALRPLERAGLVNAAAVSLAISMVIRFVPMIVDEIGHVREANAARGLERNPIALVVPVIVRTLAAADQIAEAMEARSFPPGGENSSSRHKMMSGRTIP